MHTMIRLTVFCGIAAICLPLPAQAQQASARGMAGNMNLMRLDQKIENLTTSVQTLHKTSKTLLQKNIRYETCAAKGLLYSPKSDRANARGCVHAGPRPCGSVPSGTVISLKSTRHTGCSHWVGSQVSACFGTYDNITITLKQCEDGTIRTISATANASQGNDNGQHRPYQ